jgi:hypothetical protein
MEAFGSAYSGPAQLQRVLKTLFGVGGTVGLTLLSASGVATRTELRWFVVPWGEGTHHPWVWAPPGVPVDPPTPNYIPSKHLVFYQTQLAYPGGAILEFGHPCYAWPLRYIPSTRPGNYTIVIHNIFVIRVSDQTQIPVETVSVRFDNSSWSWTISMNLKSAQTLALIEPVNGEPCEILIDLDGFQISAIVEEWSRSLSLGSDAYTVSGRSPLALLASPYAPTRSFTQEDSKTAAQLIDFELLNTGWTSTYDPAISQLFTTDWLVPGGAWSYQNLSPIEAITKVAKAVGARAYADRHTPVVRVVPAYRTSVWDWPTATPDAFIPLYLPRQISTQLNPKPVYNHVYVSGESQGVLVSATRAGTAGDRPAPMVTDKLITFVGAGTEAARNIFCDTGRQAIATFDMPLNQVTGLLEPGQLVEVAESAPWRGVVTAVDIRAKLGVISQSVSVERHYS